jgi:glucosyl-dolichyl phosphate glucuronosyltransferase
MLSIVICTYNRSALLKECLASLVSQRVGRDDYEIIVVDNNSSDDTSNVAGDMLKNERRARVIRETQQGTSYARNRGVRESRGEYIAFLDDDGKAQPGWVERLFWIIQNCDYDCVGGVYLPWYREGKVDWFKDEYASNQGLEKQVDYKIGLLPDNCYASSGNCIMKRSAIEAAGFFPTHLGPMGNRFGYGEETLLQVLIKARGGTIGFDPDLVIIHDVSSKKQHLAWLIYAQYLEGLTAWKAFDRRPGWRAVSRCFVEGGAMTLKALVTSTGKSGETDYYYQNWLYDVLKWPAFHAGKIVAAVNYK